jgi:hypothetical protein
MSNYRSVHNIRIERLWRDYADGVTTKWKRFFEHLERDHGLIYDRPSHIWLLHRLFLDAVNQDAQDWKAVWNNHLITLPGEPPRSPRDIFLFSMLLDGFRGIEPGGEVDDAVTGEDGEDTDVDEYPNNTPSRMSQVICEQPDCPLTQNLVDELDLRLNQQINPVTGDMMVRSLVWQIALDICHDLQDDDL